MILIKYLPIVTPAIDSKTFNVDYNLLAKRVCLVGLATLGFIASTNYLPASWLIKSSVLFALPLAIGLIDFCLSDVKADLKAAYQYFDKQTPAHSARLRIRRSYGFGPMFLANRLRKKEINESSRCYNKVDDRKYTLLSHTDLSIAHDEEPIDFDAFKSLVDANPSIMACDFIYFASMHDDDIEYLEYLLSTGKCKPENFSASELAELWENVGSKAAELLSLYGFEEKSSEQQRPSINDKGKGRQCEMTFLDGPGDAFKKKVQENETRITELETRSDALARQLADLQNRMSLAPPPSIRRKK